MLKLSHLTPFAVGGARYCFVHPYDSTKCVKPLPRVRPRQSISVNIPKRKSRFSVRKKLRALYRGYIYPRSDYKHLLLRDAFEFAEYRRISKTSDKRVWRHVPRHFGFVETDMGPASVMELVRNHDGTFPPTLADRICNGNFPEQAIAEFQSFLRSPGLPHWCDTNLSNIVCARINANDHERLFVVDGLECNRVKLLWSRMSNSYLRKLALRRCHSFDKKLARGLERNAINKANLLRC